MDLNQYLEQFSGVDYTDNLIAEIRSELEKYFPNCATVVSEQPNYSGYGTDIVIYVLVGNMDVDVAMGNLDRFDGEWWLENAKRDKQTCIVPDILFSTLEEYNEQAD